MDALSGFFLGILTSIILSLLWYLLGREKRTEIQDNLTSQVRLPIRQKPHKNKIVARNDYMEAELERKRLDRETNL